MQMYKYTNTKGNLTLLRLESTILPNLTCSSGEMYFKAKCLKSIDIPSKDSFGYNI